MMNVCIRQCSLLSFFFFYVRKNHAKVKAKHKVRGAEKNIFKFILYMLVSLYRCISVCMFVWVSLCVYEYVCVCLSVCLSAVRVSETRLSLTQDLRLVFFLNT